MWPRAACTALPAVHACVKALVQQYSVNLLGDPLAAICDRVIACLTPAVRAVLQSIFCVTCSRLFGIAEWLFRRSHQVGARVYVHCVLRVTSINFVNALILPHCSAAHSV